MQGLSVILDYLDISKLAVLLHQPSNPDFVVNIALRLAQQMTAICKKVDRYLKVTTYLLVEFSVMLAWTTIIFASAKFYDL